MVVVLSTAEAVWKETIGASLDELAFWFVFRHHIYRDVGLIYQTTCSKLVFLTYLNHLKSGFGGVAQWKQHIAIIVAHGITILQILPTMHYTMTSVARIYNRKERSKKKGDWKREGVKDKGKRRKMTSPY